MKVLVTGAAGLIGSHLCDSLTSKGYNVVGIDDLSFGNIDNVSSEVKFYVDKVENINLYGKFDVIYHLASLKKVWDGSISSCNVMDTNFNMTKYVVEKAIKDKSKLIFNPFPELSKDNRTFK